MDRLLLAPLAAAAKCPSLPHPIVTSGKQPARRCAVSPVEPRFLGPFAPPPSPRHGSRRARWWGLTGSLTGPGIRTPAPDGDRHSGRSRGFSGCLRQGAVRTEHRKSVVHFFNTASSSFHCRRLFSGRSRDRARRLDLGGKKHTLMIGPLTVIIIPALVPRRAGSRDLSKDLQTQRFSDDRMARW